MLSNSRLTFVFTVLYYYTCAGKIVFLLSHFSNQTHQKLYFCGSQTYNMLFKFLTYSLNIKVFRLLFSCHCWLLVQCSWRASNKKRLSLLEVI